MVCRYWRYSSWSFILANVFSLEGSSSVIECLAQDQGVVGLSLTGVPTLCL